MTTKRLLRRSLATAALTAGLAIGLAATATAADNETDFLECAAGHPDDIGVCCVFYGGDYDERSGECWIDFKEATVQEATPQPGPKVKPGLPVLTPAQRLPVYAQG
jgi:hypothetical protein